MFSPKPSARASIAAADAFLKLYGADTEQAKKAKPGTAKTGKPKAAKRKKKATA